MHRHKAVRSFTHARGSPVLTAAIFCFLRAPQGHYILKLCTQTRARFSPMTMGVPCPHGDVKCLLGDRMVTTSPSVVMNNFLP